MGADCFDFLANLLRALAGRINLQKALPCVHGLGKIVEVVAINHAEIVQALQMRRVDAVGFLKIFDCPVEPAELPDTSLPHRSEYPGRSGQAPAPCRRLQSPYRLLRIEEGVSQLHPGTAIAGIFGDQIFKQANLLLANRQLPAVPGQSSPAGRSCPPLLTRIPTRTPITRATAIRKVPSFFIGLSFLQTRRSRLTSALVTFPEKDHRAGNKNRRIGADDDADQHGEGKIADDTRRRRQ